MARCAGTSFTSSTKTAPVSRCSLNSAVTTTVTMTRHRNKCSLPRTRARKTPSPAAKGAFSGRGSGQKWGVAGAGEGLRRCHSRFLARFSVLNFRTHPKGSRFWEPSKSCWKSCWKSCSIHPWSRFLARFLRLNFRRHLRGGEPYKNHAIAVKVTDKVSGKVSALTVVRPLLDGVPD